MITFVASLMLASVVLERAALMVMNLFGMASDV
jgi:hypothetical protein